MKKIMMSCIALLILLSTVASVAETTYRIGVYQEEPFSSYHDGKYFGMSISIWREIAEAAHIKYKFVPLTGTTSDAINMLAAHKLDGLVGPVSVLSNRVDRVNFSRPYFISQLGIVSKNNTPGFWHVFSGIVKSFLSYTLLVYVAFLFIYTLVFWYVERRCKNEGFTGAKLPSFMTALFRISSLFLTQDIDQEVKSPVARMLGIIWVLFSIVFLSVVVGVITSSMTIVNSDLDAAGANSLKSLYGTKLAARDQSYAAHIAGILGADVVKTQSYTEAMALLKKNKVSAVVGNYLSLRYFDKQTPDKRYAPRVLSVGSNELAFAFPKGSPLLDRVNKQLTILQEKNTIFGVCERFVGPEEAVRCII